MKQPRVDIARMNEDIIQEYFEKRGYHLERLDESKVPNADEACEWLVESNETTFLCEVKTIQSVQRGINTGSEFKEHFEKPVRDYFRRAKVGSLAYTLRIDSDSIYAFSPREHNATQEEREATQRQRDAFLKWLKKSILSIDAGKKPVGWSFDEFSWPQYWSVYTIEKKDGSQTKINVTLTKSSGNGIELSVHWYGDLNTRTIGNSVSKAVGQLRSAASKHPGVARLVVLGFASKVYVPRDSGAVAFSGLAFKGKDLWGCIKSLLRRYRDLSAIAILNWAQDNLSPQKVEGLQPMSTEEFFKRFDQTISALEYFNVFHNDNLHNVKPLDKRVFDDGRSVQYFNANQAGYR